MSNDAKLIKKYLGKSIEEVEKMLASEGICGRVMRMDKKSFVGTCDHKFNRVNLEIDNGIVTNAWVG